MSQLELNNQTRNLGNETGITTEEANHFFYNA